MHCTVYWHLSVAAIWHSTDGKAREPACRSRGQIRQAHLPPGRVDHDVNEEDTAWLCGTLPLEAHGVERGEMLDLRCMGRMSANARERARPGPKERTLNARGLRSAFGRARWSALSSARLRNGGLVIALATPRSRSGPTPRTTALLCQQLAPGRVLALFFLLVRSTP